MYPHKKGGRVAGEEPLKRDAVEMTDFYFKSHGMKNRVFLKSRTELVKRNGERPETLVSHKTGTALWA